jgi:hypothetical protein
MEKKLTKKTKKAITIYVMVLLILFVIVEILPKVTDVFDTTQVLEPGNLVISYDTEGYLIKDESISIAAQNGKVKYLEEEGVAVKKGHPIVKVEEDKKDSENFTILLLCLKNKSTPLSSGIFPTLINST